MSADDLDDDLPPEPAALTPSVRVREHLSTGNGQCRAGIVHRLDKDTSGVILVAKDDATHRELAMQFESRKVFKEYVAIAAGELGRDSDYIEGALKMHPHDRLRM